MTTHPLQSILADVNGATFISIDTKTEPVLRGGKKNLMQGKITKVMIGANVMVFTNKNSNGYENMVERRLTAEGKDPASFSLGPRQWGVRIEGTPFVEHKGELYLEVIFLKAGDVHFLHGVRPIAREEIDGLQEDAAEGHQGGLNNKVIIRTFKVANIAAINVNKKRFVF